MATLCNLPRWVSPLHRAWLRLGREALYADLAREAKTTIAELEILNREMCGGHDNGWFVSGVTVPRVVAGDKLWNYILTLKRELGL